MAEEAPAEGNLLQAAEKLVRQRRARELQGGERWETFAGKHLHKRRGSGHGKGTTVAS